MKRFSPEKISHFHRLHPCPSPFVFWVVACILWINQGLGATTSPRLLKRDLKPNFSDDTESKRFSTRPDSYFRARLEPRGPSKLNCILYNLPVHHMLVFHGTHVPSYIIIKLSRNHNHIYLHYTDIPCFHFGKTTISYPHCADNWYQILIKFRRSRLLFKNSYNVSSIPRT